MDELIQRLKRFRASARRLLVQAQCASVVVGVIMFIAVVGMLDFVFRLPDLFRFVLLLGGLVALGWMLVRRVWPAIKFHPSLVEMALRVERHHPGVQGRLASAVDLAMAHSQDTNPLAKRSIDDAQSRATTVSFKGLLDARNARWLLILAGLAIILGAIFAGVRPTDASIAAQRVLLPFGSANWPARTALASGIEGDLVHPRGEPLVFAADLVKGDPDSDRVYVRYRYFDDGEAEPWQDLQMTRQSGTRFERVVDTDAEAIEYIFVSTDSQTPMAEVRVLPAPSLLASEGTIDPPAYAASLGSRSAALGTGTDRRARFESPILEGSRARITFTLNRPLPIQTDDQAAWLERTFALPGEGAPAEIEFQVDPEDPTTWNIDFQVIEEGDLIVNLQDEYGLENLDPIRFRFDTIKDREPSVTISRPAGDEAVSPRAIVPVIVEARDDVQLETLSLEATLQQGGQDSRIETLVSRSND